QQLYELHVTLHILTSQAINYALATRHRRRTPEVTRCRAVRRAVVSDAGASPAVAGRPAPRLHDTKAPVTIPLDLKAERRHHLNCDVRIGLAGQLALDFDLDAARARGPHHQQR